MKNWKKSKVAILPTEKVTNIINDRGRLEFIHNKQVASTINSIVKGYHLYITNPNEEIKEGNWVYHTRRNIIFQVKEVLDNHLIPIGFGESITLTPTKFKCKKIIATTDESLKIDYYDTDSYGIPQKLSLPRPSNEFLKKYCELGGIDEVLVKYEEIKSYSGNNGLMIDKYLKIAPDNTITIKPIKDSWSREEVILLLDKFVQDLNQRKSGHTVEFKENWIKENL